MNFLPFYRNIIYRYNTYISMLYGNTVTIYANFIEGASI